MSQVDFGRSIGLVGSPSSINSKIKRIEGGQQDPNYDELVRIADLIGRDVVDLMNVISSEAEPYEPTKEELDAYDMVRTDSHLYIDPRDHVSTESHLFLSKILSSGDVETIKAIRQNLQQFAELVTIKKKYRISADGSYVEDDTQDDNKNAFKISRK
jgi:transcriptional regulator with XRE-family HTH domain